MNLRLELNGEARSFEIAGDEPLIDVLRDAGLASVRLSCGIGLCGACTVLLDGRPVNSCLVLGVEAGNCEVVTIEGIQSGPGRLHPLQENFIKYGGAQCGFCTPGLIVMAKSLLDENPDPSEADIRFGIAGNICRCTGYTKIIEAIQATARQQREARG